MQAYLPISLSQFMVKFSYLQWKRCKSKQEDIEATWESLWVIIYKLHKCLYEWCKSMTIDASCVDSIHLKGSSKLSRWNRFKKLNHVLQILWHRKLQLWSLRHAQRSKKLCELLYFVNLGWRVKNAPCFVKVFPTTCCRLGHLRWLQVRSQCICSCRSSSCKRNSLISHK